MPQVGKKKFAYTKAGKFKKQLVKLLKVTKNMANPQKL